MTTTVPTALTPRSAATDPDLTGFTLVHRALRSGTRMLADALDGIARDDACDRARQQGIVRFARSVLLEVSAHLEREDAALWPLAVGSTEGWADLASLAADHAQLQRLLGQAHAALPVFARCPSSGAPLLAPVPVGLADLLESHLDEEEAPAEADPATRLLLALGRRRYARARDAVLG